MKKIIVIVLLLLFVSKYDLSNITTKISNRLDNVNTLFSNIKLNGETTKDIINYIKDPKDFLTDIIDKDFEKLHTELNTLEKEYYDKLLIEYNIDKQELINFMEQSKENDDMAKKQFIMSKANLTEMEYYQLFIFPFNKIDKPEIEDDMSFTEFKDSYEHYLIESINYLENKLED